MVLMAKFTVNIATLSILDTNPNLNIKAGWMLKLFRANREIGIRVQGVSEKYLKPKEWSPEWEITTETALAVLSVTRNWIQQLVAKVPMRKFIVNLAIRLNLVPKLEQNLREKRLSRAGAVTHLFPTCTKRMMICWPEPLWKLGSSKPRKENKIAAQNATEKFLKLKRWSLLLDHGITKIASVAWIVLVFWTV